MQVDALSFLGFVGPVFDDAQFVSVAPVFLDDYIFVGDWFQVVVILVVGQGVCLERTFLEVIGDLVSVVTSSVNLWSEPVLIDVQYVWILRQHTTFE